MGRCRNHYYDGKPLKSDEFSAEQSYFRQDLNALRALFFGMGIVYGFTLKKQKGSRFFLDKGMAIDEEGRILFHEQSDVYDIREIAGFHHLTKQRGYLQIIYEEQDLVNEQTAQASMIQEGFFLRLVEQPLEMKPAFFKYHTLYEDSQVSITLRIPAYFSDCGMMSIHFLIHKKASVRMHFHCACTSNHYRLTNTDEQIDIRFEDTRNDTDIVYILEKKETAKGKRGYLSFIELACAINDNHISMEDVTISFPLIHDLPEMLKTLLYTKSTYEKKALQLGYITFHLDGEDVIVDEAVSQVSEFSNRPVIEQHLSELLQAYGYQLKEKKKELSTQQKQNSGSFRIQLNEDETLYVSDEIAHGLGAGNVHMQAGVHIREGNELCFGNTTLFCEPQEEVELAIRVMMETGTFQIACRVPRYHTLDHVDIVWFAEVYPAVSQGQKLSLLRLDPITVELTTFSSYTFTPVFLDEADIHDVVFAVDDQRGGSIDEEGTFHAADQPGIYQISAACHDETVYAYAKVVSAKNE